MIDVDRLDFLVTVADIFVLFVFVVDSFFEAAAQLFLKNLVSCGFAPSIISNSSESHRIIGLPIPRLGCPAHDLEFFDIIVLAV